MESIVRTLWGIGLMSAKYPNLPIEIPKFTTLNEKFGIATNQTLAANEIPGAIYYAIGNQGHRVEIGANEIPLTSPIEHDPTHAALYGHLPFVLRPVMNDLPKEKRDQYALRKELLIGAEKYYAYYLKRLDFTNAKVNYYKTTVIDGEETTVPYVPNSGNLSPLKPKISATSVTTTSSSTVYASTEVTINFNAFDVEELINACKILYNDERYAIISEIAICSGVDRQLSGLTAGNSQIVVKEAICVQVNAFVSASHNVAETNQGFTRIIDLGENEPLMTGSSELIATVP